MKRITIILLMLLGSTTLFCQARADGIAGISVDTQHVPYKVKHDSPSTKNGEIWRPFNSYLYGKPDLIAEESSYRYDTTGLLQQIDTRRHGDSMYYYVDFYNRTFTKEGFDFVDTLTDYILKDGKYIPTDRIYCDHHYYDCYPQDSFYYAEYREKWNDTTQEWEKREKFYQGYFDTTLFIIREHVFFDYIDGEWVKYFGYRVLREYNEDGVLTSQTRQTCNSQTGEYEMELRGDFVYDEDTIHIETWFYSPIADDWELIAKHIDIQYAEWYPNCQPAIEFNGYANGPEFPPLSGKRAKMKSFTEWRLNDNNEWEKFGRSKHDWYLNGTQSHIDTGFISYNNMEYLWYINKHLYDERGDFIQNSGERFTPLTGALNLGVKFCFLFSYHPIYDEVESEYAYYMEYKTSIQKWDSSFVHRFEYFNWYDVTQPVSIVEPEPSASAALSIFPNPVSGVVTIAAGSEMQQLSIYDITGRLVESRSPAGERVVFDTGALPQGVYIVRALLRDGGVRTGKVVKN